MPIQHPSPQQIDAVLDQMRAGRAWDDEDADYEDGELRIYRWDAQEAVFRCERMCTVVGAYHVNEPVSEAEVRARLSEVSVRKLERGGFEV